MGWIEGLVACVLGFVLVLGVAFLCKGLTVLLIVMGLFIYCRDKGLA